MRFHLSGFFMIHQRTLASSTRSIGVGLHSGCRVGICLRPAPIDAGIVFRRTDLPTPVEIPASALHVHDTRLASVLEKDGARVSTVEHLLSACAGLGIDNLYVDLDAEEVPIMDGSASTFVFMLQSAGIVTQNADKRFIRITSPIEVGTREGEHAKWARLEPHFGFKLRFSIDFDHPAIDQTANLAEIDFARHGYVKEVARARTFGFVQDVETLRAQGLARGGSLQNAIVMDEYRVLNTDGLRYDDEFVKHKILDAIGDLYLLGHPLIAAYSAHRSGHALNNELARAVLAQPQCWEWMSFDSLEQAPEDFSTAWAVA